MLTYLSVLSHAFACFDMLLATARFGILLRFFAHPFPCVYVCYGRCFFMALVAPFDLVLFLLSLFLDLFKLAPIYPLSLIASKHFASPTANVAIA